MFKDFISASDATQSAWAARLDISRAHMSSILSGNKQPSAELMWRIELATGGAVPMQSWFLHRSAA